MDRLFIILKKYILLKDWIVILFVIFVDVRWMNELINEWIRIKFRFLIKCVMYDVLFKINNVCIIGVYGCIFFKDWDGEWYDSSDIIKDIMFIWLINNVIGWSIIVF